MKRLVLFLTLCLVSPYAVSKEVSFDCEGTYTYKDGRTEILKPQLDFDLDNLTGTRTNAKGRTTSFHEVELTPKYLRAFEFSSYEGVWESVMIDRETLSSKVNGAVGKCVIVDRNMNRAF